MSRGKNIRKPPHGGEGKRGVQKKKIGGKKKVKETTPSKRRNPRPSNRRMRGEVKN